MSTRRGSDGAQRSTGGEAPRGMGFGMGRRMGRGTLVGLAAAALLGGGTVRRAVAQPAPTPTAAWVRERLGERLDAPTRAAVERLVDSTTAAGVPAEPLVDKALEGASKRAPREAIVRAVRGLAADISTARAALGGSSNAVELVAAAAALRGGVDDEALRRLRRDRVGQPLVVPLAVLADLVASGVPADDASRTVLSLTGVGIADEQLVAFRREVERDIGIGAPPAAAATLRAESLRLNLFGDGGGPSGPGRPGSRRQRP